MTRTDEELLNDFVKSDDEQAFRCLAERYSGLIFHTALRTLNERPLAEEVAQRWQKRRVRLPVEALLSRHGCIARRFWSPKPSGGSNPAIIARKQPS